MRLTPCEYIVWHGLPVLRKEIARSMINDFGLKEVEAAKKLGISASAISQYLSGKRAKDEITNVEITGGGKRSLPESCSATCYVSVPQPQALSTYFSFWLSRNLL